MLFKFLFKKKKKLQEKFDINKWMNLTKEERLAIDFNEKNTMMRKKKALLKSIREEYVKIKKGDNYYLSVSNQNFRCS